MSDGMPVIVPNRMPSDPIVYQLEIHDKRARTAYEQSAQLWFECFVSWDNLTTAEQDYWREHVE